MTSNFGQLIFKGIWQAVSHRKPLKLKLPVLQPREVFPPEILCQPLPPSKQARKACNLAEQSF